MSGNAARTPTYTLGSPQAQRIVMLGLAGIEAKIKMAEQVISGTDNVKGVALPDAN